MHLFDQDISLTKTGPLQYKGNISENWSINKNPNGGYLMAFIANAMLKEAKKKTTPIITANYINRCVPGETDVVLEEISDSKQFNRFEAKLIQGGKERIRALGTFAGEQTDCFIQRYEMSAPKISSIDSCVPIPALPTYSVYENVDIRLDPEIAGWMQGKHIDKSEMKGWAKLMQARPFDILSVLLIADAFPPAVFVSQGMEAWLPTIELTVNLRNIPGTEWLICIQRTKYITCGLIETDGEVWDELGNLAAISRQIAMYRKSG